METFNKLTLADENQVISRAQVFRWYNAFLDDRMMKMNLVLVGRSVY